MPPSQMDGSNVGLTNYEFMQRKIAEQREKTRHRMTQYRLRLKSAPPEAQEATRQRAREARARYREKNRLALINAARCHRKEYVNSTPPHPPLPSLAIALTASEFERTHGTLAANAKAERRLERQRLRIERTRRKGRLQAAGKPKSRKRVTRTESSSSEDNQSDEERTAPNPPPAFRKRALSTNTSQRVSPPASSDEDNTPLVPPPSSASAGGQRRSRQAAARMEQSDEENAERRLYIEHLKAQRRIRLGRPHPEYR
ncbi:hypothetical protein B0H11DRAFT_1941969 [Mycena galericulata]|nr:hypothetical protein B0H11DRAFT_1941969 [Mycena galericulata]